MSVGLKEAEEIDELSGREVEGGRYDDKSSNDAWSVTGTAALLRVNQATSGGGGAREAGLARFTNQPHPRHSDLLRRQRLMSGKIQQTRSLL